MRKNCSSDREFFLKFEAEGQEFAKKFLTVGPKIFGNKIRHLHKNKNKKRKITGCAQPKKGTKRIFSSELKRKKHNLA